MNFIKTLIGKLTLPEDVYVDMMGYYWLECPYIPDHSKHYLACWDTCAGFSGYKYRDYSHPYNYRGIEQNCWGKWVKTELCVGLYQPLKKLGE